MVVKDILLALTTYPQPTPISAVDEAIDFAAAVGARISAVACEVRYQIPRNLLGNALLDVPAMAAAEAKKSSANAENLLAAFQDAAERRGVFQERILEHCLTSEVSDVLIEHARLRDLTIVPVPEDECFEQWYAEVDHIRIWTSHTDRTAGTETRRRIRNRYCGRGLGLQPACSPGRRRCSSDIAKGEACMRRNNHQ